MNAAVSALLRCDMTSTSSTEWRWTLLDPSLCGCLLLDPTIAQHTDAVRTARFLSRREIDIIVAAAGRHQTEHDRYSKTGGGSSDVAGKLYLQHDGVPRDVEPIVERLEALVRELDAKHWGILASDEVAADGCMTARCVEFHEYGPSGRNECQSHYDAGSLFTADVMLSDTADFEGGEMLTTATDEDGAERVTRHVFEQGDCLVFLSHKAHSVARVRSGRRAVLVVEFWQGGLCVANHRCCDGGVGRDPLCGNAEGAATYYSRYCRDPDEAEEEEEGAGQERQHDFGK